MNAYERFELYHFYYHLLNTVQEGLDYVLESFHKLELTEAEKVFSDIMRAFYHIDSSNVLIMDSVAEEDPLLLHEIRRFDEVINELDHLEFMFFQPLTYETYLKDRLAPVFVLWKDGIQKRLQPYILQ
ncbi:hypothetical protein J9317_17975 [Metabacillus sp. KIGAM252]|uniref:DUF8042 domain-containing protein n=1 Tax=Metabacillus flavus TaxID=2823519 RepID=A0ABS5LIR8_9BACI|nr:hypothetical protein [Metabacillus flavus]MBS2970635.1 hypothetical protein [Metabacillus flavus]